MATKKEPYQSEYFGQEIDAAIREVGDLGQRVSTLERNEFTPTLSQQMAIDSGINSTLVSQISANEVSINHLTSDAEELQNRVTTLEQNEFQPTSEQQEALNSGIDGPHVSMIDDNATRIAALEQSQFTPSSSQLAALNSGIDSTKVTQITANQNEIAEITAGIGSLVDAGAKNIIPVLFKGKTKNGVTGIVNDDKSITISGVSTASGAFVLVYDTADADVSNSYSTNIPVEPGTYICKGTNDSRIKIQAWNYTDGSDAEALANSKDDVEFTVTTKPCISFRIYISSGADFTEPLIIYPMCALKSSLTFSSAYTPFVPSQATIAQKFTDFSRYENPVDVLWFDGFINPADGTLTADSNYRYSSLFTIRKGQRLTWSSTGPSSIAQLAKYVNGQYIGNLVDVTENVRLRYLIPHKFWVADQDCQLRICHRITANGSSIIVQDTDVKPVIYNDEQFLSGSPLWGKKIVVLGDSLVHGSRLNEYPTWLTWLAAKYHMTAVNEGINGSTIAELPEGTDGDDTHDPIVNRYQDVLRAHPDADIVVYEGGANDRSQGVPIGNTTSTTKTEFSGAINRIINGTRILCPKSKIFFISLPWRWTGPNQTTGLNEADYANAMKSVCDAKSIPSRHPCFEGDIDFRDSYVASWADEGLWPGVSDPPEANRHYSPEGYQYILPRVERFLNQ